MCEGFTGQLKFLFLTHRLTSAVSLGVAQGDILISVTRDFQIDPASFTRMDPLVKLVEFVARLPARNVACIEMAIGVCHRVIALEHYAKFAFTVEMAALREEKRAHKDSAIQDLAKAGTTRSQPQAYPFNGDSHLTPAIPF